VSAEADFYAALGQCVSAAAGVFGLGFIGWQIMVPRRTADLQALQTFLRDAKDHEAALIKARDPGEKDQTFIEYLNFLETYATALNGKLFPATSREIVNDKITDALVVISDSTEWHPKLEAAITSHTTFVALRRFMERNRKAMKAVRESRTSMVA
jgi:hypothetical protein